MTHRSERSGLPGGLPDWFPLYLVLLLGATCAPFRLRATALPPWAFEFSTTDVVVHALLFVPLGLALRRRSWLLLLGVAVAFSLGIEWIQGWVLRGPNWVDGMANLPGAACGWLVGRRLRRPPALRRRPWLYAGALAAALAFVLVSHATSPAHDFSNWELFPLTVGNVASGNRPWRGRLSELAVYDRATTPDEVLRGAVPWSEGGPVLYLRFGEPLAGRLDGPAGPQPIAPDAITPVGDRAGADGPVLEDGLALPEEAARHLRERLVATGRLSVAARIEPHALRRTRAARIFSFAPDVYDVNVALIQRNADLELRVRTPAVGRWGTSPFTRTCCAPLSTKEQLVLAVYDGSSSRIYVDGRCERELPIALRAAPPPLGATLGAVLVVCTALGTLALGSAPRRASRSARAAAGVAGGLGVWSLLWWTGLWAHLNDFDPTAVGLGIASIASSLACLPRSEGGRPP